MNSNVDILKVILECQPMPKCFAVVYGSGRVPISYYGNDEDDPKYKEGTINWCDIEELDVTNG